VNRRRLILSAAGAGMAVSGIAGTTRGRAATAATDDELAYANFGQATELLLQDYYAKLAAAKLVRGPHARDLARGAFNAGEHAAALAKLLTDAGQAAAAAEDFAFEWPEGTFSKLNAAATAGVTVTRALLGTYIGAAATISIPSYRALYASMAANLAQQVGVLSALAAGRAVGVSFPAALGVEAASDAIEAYLG
jgi:hypothetical protein